MAYDLAVLARRYFDMQVILWDVDDNTNTERYCVNPSKCSCLNYNSSKNQHKPELTMAGKNISVRTALSIGVLAGRLRKKLMLRKK